ncbi:porin family protein [Bacteroidota bacterium]
MNRIHRELIILITGLLILSIQVDGQTFKGGISGGFTTTQIDGDNWGGFNKLGLHAGGYVFTELNKYLKAQFEIRYVGKGATSGFNIQNSTFAVNSLNYIEFPVSLNVLYGDKYIIEAGIYEGFLLYRYVYDESGVLNANDNDEYKRLDTGLFGGLGYKISEKLDFRVRYSYSLFKIRELDYFQIKWLRTINGEYNNVISMGLYYEI